MAEQFVLLLLWFTAALGAILALLCMVGANAYDIRAARAQRDRRRQPHARRYRWRPLVTVVIVAHNDASRLPTCLTALAESAYRKLELIVVDNASKDDSKAVIREMIGRFPKRNLRLVAKRQAAPWLVAGREAYRRHGHGELVMLLSADDIVEPLVFERAVKRLADQPAVDILLPARPALAISTLGALLQRYTELWTLRARKFNSVFGGGLTVSAEAAMCRSAAFTALLKALQATGADSVPSRRLNGLRAYYADDIFIRHHAEPSLWRLFRQAYRYQLSWLEFLRGRRSWLRWPLLLGLSLTALAVPLLGGYFIYLAVRLHQPVFLLISWAMLAVWLVSMIWSVDDLKLPQKVGYTLGLPVTFGLFYVLSFMPALAALRNLAIGRQL